jgi:hypothetical protein
MNEIRCPHCGTVFTIDEAEYADIAQQVRTTEFEKDLHARLAEAEKAKQTEIELAEAKVAQREQKAAAEKDAEIERLKGALNLAKTEQELAVTKAVTDAEKKLSDAENMLQLQAATRAAELAAERESHSKELAFNSESYSKELATKDELIERYKDMKAKLSVKLLGETLEQHCEIEFNRARSLAFPYAKFGKDNDASGGTKGDYVFRDYSADGVEYISVMFEMKNEADDSSSKKKNSEFFAKLDKDRKAKGCEYAVLVSMLEEDSELYTGITDVSTPEYPKMFVIRPQFFLAIIALLRNAARDTIQVKAELEQVKQENIDITNFESNLLDFQTKFSKNVGDAAKQYRTAVDDIDDAIKKLEATKEALRLWVLHLDRASDKANGLTIRALTRGNDTMGQKFAAGGAASDADAA